MLQWIWMWEFTPLCFSLLFRLAFEQDIEHGNTDGLGDCQSKQKCFKSLLYLTLEIFHERWVLQTQTQQKQREKIIIIVKLAEKVVLEIGRKIGPV